MQQVAKLHDPAGERGRHNLSLDYMLQLGDWEACTKERLTDLREKMQPFATKMKMARNKLLVHNDAFTIISATQLGGFDEGEDVDYFENLKQFVKVVVNKVLNEHFDYDDAVPADIALFTEAFDRGRIGGDFWRTAYSGRQV